MTVLVGDKAAWPIYMSIGNISERDRSSAYGGAWILIGYLPVAKFNCNKDIEGTLIARLYHQCMGVLMGSIQKAARDGIHLSDSKGDVRLCYPRLAAYIADYPEQILINVTAQNWSPVTTASFHDLGNPSPSPLRIRSYILDLIRQVSNDAHPSDIQKYQKLAKEVGLSGVHKPFWREIPDYEPENAIVPDILHAVLKFFRDHVLKWVKWLVGLKELDARLSALQPQLGFRHFRVGISKFTQMSGREDKAIARALLAVALGCPKVSAPIIKSLRGIIDFIYLIQYRSHSNTTLGYIDDALKAFHATKQAWIQSGARRGKNGPIPHFKIPKLASLHSFQRSIPQLGTCLQFTTEITELLHRPSAKEPYRATNRREFLEQMCRILDRRERIAYFLQYHHWLDEAIFEEELEGLSPEEKALYKEVFEEVIATKRRGPMPFEDGKLYRLRATPHRLNEDLVALGKRYSLLDLIPALDDFLNIVANPNMATGVRSHHRKAKADVILPFTHAHSWTYFRFQTASVQDEDVLAAARTIQALPPTTVLPYGRCNCVLVHDNANAESTGLVGTYSFTQCHFSVTDHSPGYQVAQVRMIFQLVIPDSKHPLYGKPLAYVQWFSTPKSNAEQPSNMYLLERSTRSQNLGSGPYGDVIELSSIARGVQLIPKFGEKISPRLNSTTSMDIAKWYWVNSFGDKEIYQAVW